MTEVERAAQNMAGNLEMVKGTLADFSDADFMVRPCPGANHVTWQLGHLMKSETGMMTAIGATMPPLPDGWDKKFTKENASNDDASFFPKKQEIMDAFIKMRTAGIAFVKTVKPEDLEKPTPENMRRFAPTTGNVLGLAPVHTAMHVGQFQVIRRKLGKPILF